MRILSCKSAHELPTRAEEHCWLVKDLWAQEAVGIVGGEPKAASWSWRSISPWPCLRRFVVPAEDARPTCADE